MGWIDLKWSSQEAGRLASQFVIINVDDLVGTGKIGKDTEKVLEKYSHSEVKSKEIRNFLSFLMFILQDEDGYRVRIGPQ